MVTHRLPIPVLLSGGAGLVNSDSFNHIIYLHCWFENLCLVCFLFVFFSQEEGKEPFECRLFFPPVSYFCWSAEEWLQYCSCCISKIKKNVKKTTKKSIAPMLVCSKFCMGSIFGVFVRVIAGSDTWDWCYIINMTYDRFCRAQQSSANPPQSSLTLYW